MAVYNSELVEIKKVTELISKLPFMQSFFSHCGDDGVLYKATLDQLATFLAPYITAVGGSGFVAVSGNTLPAASAGKFTIVGAGTYTQTTGGSITTTELLNVLGSSATTWALVTAISSSSLISKDFSDFGGRFSTVAEANAAIPNTVVNGKNQRAGKLVFIGTPENYTSYWWKGGFENSNLIEYLGGFASIESTSVSVNAIKKLSTANYSHVFQDKAKRVAAYIDKAGFWTALKYAANSIPGSALKMFNANDKINTGTVTLNLLDQAVKAGMLVTTSLPGYRLVVMDKARKYAFAIRDSGAVVIPKLEANNVKPLQGKNCLCIGDSVTEANNYQPTLASLTGMNITSHAKGGIGLIQMVDGDGAGFPALTSAQLSDKDVVMVFGSLNDRSSLLGLKTDMYPNKATIYAKVNYVIQKIYSLAGSVNKKDLRIVFIAPHKVGKYSFIDYDGGQEYPVGSGQTLEDICNTIKNAAGFYGIPTIDLYHNSGINNYNWDVMTMNVAGSGPFPNLDNVHPNAKGAARIGRYIGNQLNLINI